MDAIGFVASLIALIEAAGFAAKSARKLCLRFEDAPKELETLGEDLCLIHAGLEVIQQLSTGSSDAIDVGTRRVIQTTLQSAQTTLKSLETASRKLDKPKSVQSRLRWALLGHSNMHRHMEELKTMQTKLRWLFQILSFQEQATILSEVISLKEMMNSTSRPTLRQTGSQSVAHLYNNMLRLHTETVQRSRKILINITNQYIWPHWTGYRYSLLGVRVDSATSRFTEYSLAFYLSIFLGYRALVGNLHFRKHPSSFSFSVMEPSSFSVGRVVAEDSIAMEACSRGDLFTLKQQLQLGKATLSDITDKNWPFMKFAITGGNLELVRFLLDNGVNPSSTFGVFQTSALQWALQEKQRDVAELLISYGAEVNHVSLLGWTPLFYCWPNTQGHQDIRLREIELLSVNNALDLDIVDKWGWTVLHRLAAYGTAEEVRKVIDLGADLMIRQSPLSWSAIYHATFYRNFPTFLELLGHYHSSVIWEVDERGWTLLHIAASAGHADITRHLLSLGSDPWALSNPFFSHIPPSIYGQQCSPAKVAAAQSPQRLKLYESTLEELSLCERRKSEEDGVDDMFWEACEAFT